MQPLVTIAIPVYNEEKFVEKTILSAVRQTYPNLEIVISDNASTDHSWDIIQRYQHSDKRIIAYRQPQNLGVHENFDFLKLKGTGKYFMWLGGHDVAHPEFISLAVEQMEKEEKIVLYYPTAVLFKDDILQVIELNINTDLNTTGLSTQDRMLKVLDNFGTCYALHGVLRKSIMDNFEFEKYGSDHLFLLRMSFFGDLVPSRETMYYVRKVREEDDYQKMLDRLKTFGYEKNYPLHCTLSHFKSIFYWDEIRGLGFRLTLIERIYQVLAFTICRLTFSKMVKHMLVKEFHPRLFFFVLWFKIKTKFKGRPGR